MRMLVEQEIRECGVGLPGKSRSTIAPLIVQFDADTLAALTINSALSELLMSDEGQDRSRLVEAIGRAANAQLAHKSIKRDCENWYKAVEESKHLNPRTILKAVRKQKPIDAEDWGRVLRIRFGALMFDLLMQACHVGDWQSSEWEPGIEIIPEWQPNRRLKNIARLTPKAIQVVNEAHLYSSALCPRLAPMVTPPEKWSDGHGGYIKLRMPMVRRPDPQQVREMADADLSTIHKAVDAIGSVAWRVNPHVRRAVSNVEQEGGDMAGIPPMHDPVPPPKGSLPEAEWKAAAKAVYDSIREIHGDRARHFMQFAVADEFADDEFWFPHSLDFRGRAYPLPMHFHPQATDPARGTLMFSRPRPLGDHGLRWFRIHAANCQGMDKLSFAEREAWAISVWDDMRLAGHDPLRHRWWMEAEKPFQLLACCTAVAHDLIEHIPIQVDGRCNGLQHYAAMTRDADAAGWTSMTPSATPGDLYSQVASIATKALELSDRWEARAILANGPVSRSTVKQTVMTSVYGVTAIGARRQLEAELNWITDTNERFRSAIFLAEIVSDAIHSTCQGPSKAMAWIRETGRAILKTGKTIAWTSPIGLPVAQGYRNLRSKTIETLVGRIALAYANEKCPPKTTKQLQSFPPNFIHSVDSSHLMMTATECYNRGIAFAGVHDSYWTHAGSAEQLAHILRSTFVELHTPNRLELLASELRERYPNAAIEDPPPAGEYDVRDVLEAPYFFS